MQECKGVQEGVGTEGEIVQGIFLYRVGTGSISTVQGLMELVQN